MISQRDLLANLQNVLYEPKSPTFVSISRNIQSLNQHVNDLIRTNFNVVTLLNTLSEKQQQEITPTIVKKKSKFQKPTEKQSLSSTSGTKLPLNDKNIPILKQQLSKLKQTTEKLFTQYFQPIKMNSEFMISQSYYLILVKSYCLIIVLKLQLQIHTVSDENDTASVQQEIYRLQSLLSLSSKRQTTKSSGISLTSKLVKLCIRELMNLDSINQYEFYNIHSNEEFKFDEKTQQKFLYILSVVKLSSHLKFFAYQKKSVEEIKVIQKIYQEGKDALLRLENLNQSRSKRQFSSKKVSQTKLSYIEVKTKEIRSYLTWVEVNWIQSLRQRISKRSVSSQFKQLPIELMPAYELFFIIHKLSQFQQQYVQKQDLKKFQYQIKGEILRSAQQKKLWIKKYLQEVQGKEQGKIHLVLQWVLNQIEAHMRSCEQNCNKLSLQKLDNLIKNTPSCSLINQFQDNRKSITLNNAKQDQPPSFKLTQSTLLNGVVMEKIAQISQTKIKEEKPQQHVQKEQKQKTSRKQGSNKQVNIFKTFEKQSEKDSLTPSKKSSKQIPQKSTSLRFIGSFTQKNVLLFCTKGQYLTKFNYNNNSYARKFVKLSTKSKMILWADNKEEISHDASEQSFDKIFGFVYGNVTQKMIYHCQNSKFSSHLIEPWKCFSVICKKRTLDFCCEQDQAEVFFWLNGLAAYFQEEKGVICNFSRGKMLWKKMLIKLRDRFLVEKDQQKKKDKKRFYLGKYNARAIINFGKSIENLEKPNEKSQ